MEKQLSPVEQRLEQFTNYISVQNYSRNTVLNYKADIEQYIEELGIQTAEEINEDNILEFLSRLASRQGKDKVGARSRNRKLAAIKRFCKYLRKKNVVAQDPAVELEYAKLEERLPVVFTRTEILNVITSSVNKDRDNAILETLYATGVRVSELVTAKVSGLDLEQRTIQVIGKWNRERIVPINDTALRAIAKHLQSRKVASEYIFAGEYNPEVPLTPRTVRNIVDRYGKKENNLPKISPHKFRHSCATHLHQNRMDIRDIQEFLGHVNISSTQIYTHVDKDNLSDRYQQTHPRA